MYTTCCKTPIGYAEITAHDQAILSVSLVDQPAAQELNDAAAMNVPVLKQCIKELHEYFSGKRTEFSFPIDRVRGTDFQKKVWSALEKIPYGKTVSYEDIAIAVGSPKAVRAVGLANSKNPHWVVVPCHRVIGKNKKLVGYAGGLDRKKWLLEHETKRIYSSSCNAAPAV
jgi:methylated-DNA-[protein]-cysteine S-methyltransferase